MIIKRVFDIAVSAALLVLFAPLMLLISGAIILNMGRPALFRQSRPGLHERLFMLYKFRTMNDKRGPDGELLPDNQRLTRLGGILRKTSLDELPQLWNVLKGDMSLVGPRPLLPEYLGRYSPKHARRHDMRPGITGLAQINGRQEIPFGKRLDMDIEYIDNWSFWFDLKIIVQTILSVTQARGVIINQELYYTREQVDDVGLTWDPPKKQENEEVDTDELRLRQIHDAGS